MQMLSCLNTEIICLLVGTNMNLIDFSPQDYQSFARNTNNLPSIYSAAVKATLGITKRRLRSDDSITETIIHYTLPYMTGSYLSKTSPRDKKCTI